MIRPGQSGAHVSQSRDRFAELSRSLRRQFRATGLVELPNHAADLPQRTWSAASFQKASSPCDIKVSSPSDIIVVVLH